MHADIPKEISSNVTATGDSTALLLMSSSTSSVYLFSSLEYGSISENKASQRVKQVDFLLE